jgi:hypothetical protein
MSSIGILEPLQESFPAPESPAVSDQEIISSLEISLPRTAVSSGYGIAMILLAGWLTLIPLVYLAMLAFMAYLVVWHLYEAVDTFSDGPFFIFHLPMAFLGGLLLLFLIKPVFFRRRAKKEESLVLTEADEPLLFAYVRKLCAATGSKPPTRIEVDCEANAHARLRRGIVSMFTGELVLRIGLPLAADLSLRQFTGVLAHEFGHFNQRHGMSGSYLIRRLTFFFAQIVFQRDKLDERLAKNRHSLNALRQGMYWLLLGPIEAARGVLCLMLVIGEVLTCGVLRRMEYDADRMEALVAGTGDFIQTSHSLAFLALAGQLSRADLAESWEERRVADDLPRLIVANGKHLSSTRRDLLARVERQKTRWLDTHPAHTDRIRAVESIGCAGLMQCDSPATRLFANFDGLCQRATQAFYRGTLGDKFKEAKLISTADYSAERLAQRQAYRALTRFMRGHVLAMQPIFPNSQAEVPVEDVPQAIAALNNTRQAMLKTAQTLSPRIGSFQKDAALIAAARAQMSLCRAFHRTPQVTRLESRAGKALRKTEPHHAATRATYQPFVTAARARLTTALRLLQSDLPNPRAGGGEGYWSQKRSRAAELISVCRALEPFVGPMNRLGELTIAIRVLMPSYNPRQPHQPLIRKILETTNEMADILRNLWHGLSSVPYPFDHAADGASIASAMVPKFPDARDPADTHGCAVTALNAYSLLVVRTLAELSQHAELAEEAASLDALPDPAERPDEQQASQNRGTAKYWFSYGSRSAAGIAMFAALVWYSLSPPVLPAMPWDSGGSSAGYQPNAFHVPFTPAPMPIQPMQPNRPGMPNAYPPGSIPGRPGSTPQQPLRPGMPRQPGMPGGNNSRPWSNPFAPSSPGPRAPSPRGGGGYSPGGGGSRGGGGGHR